MFLSTAEQQCLANAKRSRERRERSGADDVSSDPREISLAQMGKAAIQLIGDNKSKDRVSKKLKTLVRLGTHMFRAV